MKTPNFNTCLVLLLSTFFIFCFVLTANAAPSDLDSTFGNGGTVVWSPNGNTQSIAATGMALQADGKIVMVGGFSEFAGVTSFMIVRFNVNGSLDTTFGTNGLTVITFGGTTEIANSVAVQPNGKIVAGGRTTLGSNIEVAVARFNSDGTLDSTFSEDGKATVGFTVSQAQISDYLYVVKVADNGKIVFAGGSGPGSATLYYAHLGRFNSDGTLDSSFGSGGRLIEGLGTGFYRDLITNSDGSIYVSGDASAQFSSTIKVKKYNANGSVGWEYVQIITPGCYMGLNSMAVQPDGKLVVVGTKNCIATAFRLTSGGGLDTTFNAPAISESSRLNTVGVQADGKILASIFLQTAEGFSLVRYNADGSLDTGFGTGGIARFTAFTGDAKSLVIQPDGKILLGGGTATGFSNYRFAMVRYLGTSAAQNSCLFDYDGDGRADVSVFRPSENRWYIFRSSDGVIAQTPFAITDDKPVPADFDGDGKTDIAIFRASGDWWSLSSSNNSQVTTNLGNASDIKLPSDFDGDGRADYIIFRPSNNTWYRLSSATGTSSNVTFGLAGDKPVMGDFDGDGKSDVAIYRPSTGDWWYQSSITGAQLATRWGISTDIPTPADFDGDGKTDFAVYRASTGVWYIYNSSTGQATIMAFGLSEDKPVAADFDGDGKADIAVFRPSTGIWYQMRSTAGFTALQFGVASDIPIPNAFIP